MSKDAYMLIAILLMVPFLPAHIFNWQVVAIVVGVPVVGLLGVSLLVRIVYGHWPR